MHQPLRLLYTAFRSFLLLLYVMLYSACFVPRYKLNDQEKAFTARKGKFDMITIEYDKKAIRRMDSNGIYKVIYEERKARGFFTQAEAFARAKRIARELVPIMNFKDHHRFIHVTLTGTDNTSAISRAYLQYQCVVGLPVDDIEDAFIVQRLHWIQRRMQSTRASGVR